MISILVPFRDDPEGWRGRLLEWTTTRWRAAGFEVCVGSDGGPESFNVCRALNHARQGATGDVLVVMGCDHIPDPGHVRDRVASMSEWCSLYAKRVELPREATERILAGESPSLRWAARRRGGGRAHGLVAVRAAVWDAVGGRDERFVGWGGEDNAFQLALRTLYGASPRPDGTVRDLWHPRVRSVLSSRNAALVGLYVRAAGDPVAMRRVLGVDFRPNPGIG